MLTMVFPDTWIITGGMESGVMCLVGEAICEHALKAYKDKIMAIGIASWCALDNKSNLYGNYFEVRS